MSCAAFKTGSEFKGALVPGAVKVRLLAVVDRLCSFSYAKHVPLASNGRTWGAELWEKNLWRCR